nr:MAG TPA: growth factor-like protein [Caudoviricetes sp.]DAX25726.1 MAG TPA: growth factor-like protein [Caudoviricetes sp.]
MIKSKCVKCKYWVRYFNSNKCYCKKGYCFK